MATSDFDWQGFRALVKRLDDLVATPVAPEDDPDFAENLRRALAFVYTAGVSMPTAGDVYEDAGGDGFWDNTVKLELADADPAEREDAVATLAERIALSVEALQPDGDVDADDLEATVEIVAESVIDLLGELEDGAEHFDANRLQEAAWEWSFQFDDWGAHALMALSGAHDLLWGAR